MKFEKITPGGNLVVIEMSHDMVTQNMKSNYRGENLKRAGNFFAWDSVSQTFLDKELLNEFLHLLDEDVQRLKEEGNKSTQNACTIEFKDAVGWESSAHRANFKKDELESVKITQWSRALRIMFKVDIKVPLTKFVTIEYKVFDTAQVKIRKVYPGKDIGDFFGNVTNRSNRVLYHPDHIGEQ